MKASKRILVILAAAMVASGVAAQQAVDKSRVLEIINTYRPGVTGFGPLKVDKITFDDKSGKVTVALNENATYLPMTDESLSRLKDEVRSAFPAKCKNYEVVITAAGKNMDDLVLFAPKEVKAPTEEGRWITDMGAPAAPKGLEGKNIALWQSHGWYFEPKLNRWEWQRARIFQTVEDLYTQSYVMPFLMPMLENAGAYVMSPRERDTSVIEVIVDGDGGYATGSYKEKAGASSWTDAPEAGFGYAKEKMHNGDNPFKMGKARQVATSKGSESTAQWYADMPQAGTYAVYVSYQSLPNSSPEALYRVNSRQGSREFVIDQRRGGGTWVYLGHFPLEEGLTALPTVELVNRGPEGTVVTADAVKIGGGMGNVERIVKNPVDDIDYQYVGSGYPRFTEGARYWLQWAGAPDSVFTPTDYVNDYNDDYRSRAEWVNWLAGGSSMLPDREGLRVPVDLSFAFHSDAGTTLNDSIIGTLGIYCTVGDTLGNGSSRLASRDLTDLVMTNIVRDVRTNWEPNWTRRGMWDKSYYEARVPAVPSMLLELLSHQNFADMKYGLDPEFRFDVSRAIYKGMLQFLAHRDGREYVVQPLPVRAFAISRVTDGRARTPQRYALTWAETVDSLEPTATPTYYIVEERVGDGVFKEVARVSEPTWTAEVNDLLIHSYRVIAGNDGGVSFPSEVLALRNAPGPRPQVLVVNGFTRVSAPDWFDSGEIAGFYDVRDHGVPYKEDISFIGSQFEFRRDIPWMDDDAAGFGASRANYETKVIAGNTFDYVYTHGQAIADAGYGFVSMSIAALLENGMPSEAPEIVDLILGKQKEGMKGRGAFGTYGKTFPVALQKILTDYTEGGGSLFVSGAYIATDLKDNPYSDKATLAADEKFAAEVLGYHWRVDQASVTGEAYEVASRYREFDGGEYNFSNDLNADCYAVESPDSFYPANDSISATIMRYTENNLIAGTAMDNGQWRTVAIGFPFEAIKCGEQRARLMRQVLDFLNTSRAPKTNVTMKKKK